MKKTATSNGKTSVTFELPAGVAEGTVAVCGDFNEWKVDATPLKRRKDGSFAATVRLDPGRYRYRYLVDGDRWENDWWADAYEPNGFGSDDSILVLETSEDRPNGSRGDSGATVGEPSAAEAATLTETEAAPPAPAKARKSSAKKASAKAAGKTSTKTTAQAKPTGRAKS